MGKYSHYAAIDFFKQVYVPMRLRKGSPLTLDAYSTPLRHLEAYWRSQGEGRAESQLRIGDWNELLIAQYLASRSDLGEATQNKHLRHLKAIWNLANELNDEELGKFRLKQSKEHLREPECWSQEEFSRLLIAAAETFGRVGDVPARYWWPALILMVYATGVRINAVMHIRVADLNLDQGYVIVRADTQKQKADQRFTLIPEAVTVLRGIMPERNVLLFEDWPYDRRSKNGRRSFPTLGRHYKEILKRAGLSNGRHDLWHKLRRMFATEVTRKAGKAAAQELLGHSTQRVTERYIDKRFVEGHNAAELIRRPLIPIQLRLFNPNDPGPEGGAAQVG